MVFEKDLKRILDKYNGEIITDNIINNIISEYRKMFICLPKNNDIEKYYEEQKDDDSSNKKL